MPEEVRLTKDQRRLIQVGLCLAPSIVVGIILDRLRWFKDELIVFLLALCFFAILFGILTLFWWHQKDKKKKEQKQ